jgi:hypothetical protein
MPNPKEKAALETIEKALALLRSVQTLEGIEWYWTELRLGRFQNSRDFILPRVR